LNENGFAGRIAFLGALHVNNSVINIASRAGMTIGYAICVRFFRIDLDYFQPGTTRLESTPGQEALPGHATELM
jgi:hypothetical protein